MADNLLSDRKAKENQPFLNRSINQVTTTCTYNPASQVTQILHRLTATSIQINQAAYGYNPVDNRTSLTDRRGSQAFGHDTLDQLTSASNPLLATHRRSPMIRSGTEPREGRWSTPEISWKIEKESGAEGSPQISWCREGAQGHLAVTQRVPQD